MTDTTLYSPEHAAVADTIAAGITVVRGGVCTTVGGGPVCVWCWEPAGTCTLTGGHDACEGIDDYHLDQAELATAPHIGLKQRSLTNA